LILIFIYPCIPEKQLRVILSVLIRYGSYPAAAAPGRCSNRSLCAAGDSATEPYIAAHNLLLAHAQAAGVYRREFQSQQGGRITMALSGDWTEPLDPTSSVDREAAERRQEFQVGWFADPVWRGGYPASMRRLVGARLPRFTEEERRSLHGSCDYFALNHYTSRYAFAPPAGACPEAGSPGGWVEDQCCSETSVGRDGVPIGLMGGSDWLLSVPWGIRKLLGWLQERYPARPK